jgi:acyl-CoA synthetase (AMP-forming)/AMP-acid ligase II/acyl carrier protein
MPMNPLTSLPCPPTDHGLGQPVRNFCELARFRAKEDGDAIAYTFLVDGENEEIHLTFTEIDRQAEAIAAKLQTLGQKGDCVLLLFHPGLEYISAFFGVIYAGMIPVPAYPPDLMRADRTLPRLQSLANDCQPAVILGTRPSLALVGGLLEWSRAAALAHGKPAATLFMEDWPAWVGLPWAEPDLPPESIAFLQYTSGSTASPRGVMVTHANLLYQTDLLFRSWERDYSSRGDLGVVGVSWLPFYHDMGLIGGVLASFYSGRRVVLMSPLAFIQRPIRWLWAVSKYRPVATAAPNFAYDLCVSKFRASEVAGMDLSSLKIALNGAEPVRSETLDRFAETFAPYGFDPLAWLPSYGLAESTLGVTTYEERLPCPRFDFSIEALERNQARVVEAGSPNARNLVSSGKAITGTEVRIVDPATLREVPPDAIGEVWVRGLGVTLGYWNRPVETEATFNAHIEGGDGVPFMRTGDFGFLYEGNLYLTGRLKETMIFWGRNVYPQDLEHTVAGCHESLKLNGGAAFTVERDGGEHLVILQEVVRPARLDLPSIAAAVRKAIMAEHSIPLSALVFIRPGMLPKTSSGKIKRGEARTKFLAGELDALGQWAFDAPAASSETPARDTVSSGEAGIRLWLRERIAQLCGVTPADIAEDEPLNNYIMDSISLVTIARDLENWLGHSFTPTILFDSPTLELLAARLADPASRVDPAEAQRQFELVAGAAPQPGTITSLDTRASSVDNLSEGELDQALAELLAGSPSTEGKTDER